MDNCVVCGKAINGLFYTTEHNEKFCNAHVNPARCRYCLHLLRRGEAEPCPRCLVHGFSDISMAQGSIQRVASWMEKHLGSHALLNVPVKLNDGLDFLSNQSGLTNWRHDGVNLTVEVEMLKLSQAHIFEPTLAHEYGHVILIADPYNLTFTGGIGQSRLQEEEGFCEVLRYLWVYDNGGRGKDMELKAIKENNDQLYGDGFRLMWPRYKAAGSIVNLRAELLGLAPSQTSKGVTWPFGKKKQPIVPPPVPPSVPVTPSTQTPPTSPQVTPSPNIVEGGSHRPILDLGLDKITPKSQPVQKPSAPAERPTIDFTSQQNQTVQPATKAQPPADENRPIIRFD